MKKSKYMSEERFAELEESLQQALQHARGERHDLRTTVLPAPPKPMKKLIETWDRISAERDELSQALRGDPIARVQVARQAVADAALAGEDLPDLGPTYPNVISFGLLVLILIVRPTGILGRRA